MVLGLVAALVGAAWIGLLVGLVLGGGVARWWLGGTTGRILAAVGAEPLAAGAEPRLRNLVDGLCSSAGVVAPSLAVVGDTPSNCLVVGRRADDTTLVLTRGMLDRLDRMALEGVVARQLAAIRRGEVALATAVVPLVSIAPGLAARFLPDRYDVRADIEAVGLTRYPPGLTSALETTRDGSAVARAPRTSSHLWFDDPSPAGGEPSAVAHSPIEERIATLQEL